MLNSQKPVATTEKRVESQVTASAWLPIVILTP